MSTWLFILCDSDSVEFEVGTWSHRMSYSSCHPNGTWIAPTSPALEKSLRRGKRCILTILLVVGFSCHVRSLSAAEYVLGALDKLRIQISEFPNISGEYEIGESGTVALPILGEVEASGLTRHELSKILVKKMAGSAQSSETVAVTIEISQYRPVFISGDVQRPGAYPYQPGLTTLKALTVAGGVYRPADSGFFEIVRQSTLARGELHTLQDRILEKAAQRARCEAELNDSDTFSVDWPVEVDKEDALRDSLEKRERMVLSIQLSAYHDQLSTLSKLSDLYKSEIGSLEKQNIINERQLALTNQQLETVQSLVDRGIESAPRALQLRASASQIESNRQETVTQILRVQQSLAQTAQSELDLTSRRRQNAASMVRDIDSELRELRTRSHTEKSLVEGSFSDTGLMEVEANQSGIQASAKFKIIRRVGDKTERIDASEDDFVSPGDVVKVLSSYGGGYERLTDQRKPNFSGSLN